MTDVTNIIYSNEVENATTETGVDFDDRGFETRAIQDGQNPDQWDSRILIPPIHTGTTFKQDGPGLDRGYKYGRGGNPTRTSLETCIASLENSKYAFALASGLATVTGVCALLNAGDHVICCDDLYSGTNRHFAVIGKTKGLEIDFIDATVVELVEKGIKPNTKLIWVESLSNPLLKIVDIPSIAALVKTKNHGILLVVDNSFMTPYLQKPLDLGANIAIYSMTKYMNGHNDVTMGAITTNDEELGNRIAYIVNSMGLVPSPFDCYLSHRGLKTLAIRMDRHTQNATEIAKFLEHHPSVEKVIYPGLESHPQYELAKRLFKGASGMIAFYIKGDLKNSTALLKALKIVNFGASLGGLESLTQLPSVMSHAPIPEELRRKLGITDNLVRFSVGLETAADLIKDLDRALKIATTDS